MTVWTLEEAAAWPAPERLAASVWAERYRRLPARGSAEPGPYRLRRTPYLREIVDVLGDLEHEEVILMKPPQVGGSQAGRTAIGYWVDCRGDPILLVYPNEDAAAEEIVERVAPMFEESPQLRRHLTGRVYDVNEAQIALRESTIYVGWAGSAQALASRAIGCAIFEETDKAVRKPGEAPPEDLIRHRLKTFRGRRKFFAVSTPTTRTGTIYRLWSETQHKRSYHCRCAACGAYERWTFDGMRWEGKDRPDWKEPSALLEVADALNAGRAAAWYECGACKARITERQRMRCVEAGEWVSDGYERGQRPVSKRVAYHIEALVSPWVTFADYVVAYLRGTLAGDLQDFFNGFRGLPVEEAAGGVAASVLEARAGQHRAGVVPAWATCLTAGADTQATTGLPYWKFVVRAWGPGLRSRTVAVGRADSADELLEQTVNARFPVEDGVRAAMSPTLVCVDSGGGVETTDGSTTELVYALAKRHPAQVVAIKGHAGQRRPDRLIRASNVAYQQPGRPPSTVLLHILDTSGLKDIMASLIRATDPVLWEESDAADAAYLDEMTAEEKTRIRVGRSWRMAWINTTRRRNDWWDASVYALAGAKMLRAEERATKADEVKAQPERAIKPRPPKVNNEQSASRYGARLSVDRSRSWVSRRSDD